MTIRIKTEISFKHIEVFTDVTYYDYNETEQVIVIINKFVDYKIVRNHVKEVIVLSC